MSDLHNEDVPEEVPHGRLVGRFAVCLPDPAKKGRVICRKIRGKTTRSLEIEAAFDWASKSKRSLVISGASRAAVTYGALRENECHYLLVPPAEEDEGYADEQWRHDSRASPWSIRRLRTEDALLFGADLGDPYACVARLREHRAFRALSFVVHTEAGEQMLSHWMCRVLEPRWFGGPSWPLSFAWRQATGLAGGQTHRDVWREYIKQIWHCDGDTWLMRVYSDAIQRGVTEADAARVTNRRFAIFAGLVWTWATGTRSPELLSFADNAVLQDFAQYAKDACLLSP